MGYKKKILLFLILLITIAVINGFIFMWKYPTQASSVYSFLQQSLLTLGTVFVCAVSLDGISKNLGNKWIEAKQKIAGVVDVVEEATKCDTDSNNGGETE